MSDEEATRFRESVALWNRGEIDEVLKWVDEGGEIVSRLGALGEGAYRGHEGVRRWWRDMHEAFPDWQTELCQVRQVGHVTIAQVRLRGHGEQSRVPVDETLWQVVEWRNGKMFRLLNLTTEAEAWAEAGILR
jgi:hypothetical protein